MSSSESGMNSFTVFPFPAEHDNGIRRHSSIIAAQSRFRRPDALLAVLAGGLRILRLAKIPTIDFRRGCHFELLNEYDFARCFICGKAFSYMVFQILRKFFGWIDARRRFYERLNDRASFWISFANHGGFGDIPMGDQAFFYFCRSNAKA